MADAVIAVSEGTKEDILKHFSIAADKIHVIYNGIDTCEYSKRDASRTLNKYSIDPTKPYLLFVGRITRQKGIIHLVEAIQQMHAGFNVVLCAGAPDTPEIAEEMKQAVALATQKRSGVIWIDEMVSKNEIIDLYSGAAVFAALQYMNPLGSSTWRQWPAKLLCRFNGRGYS